MANFTPSQLLKGQAKFNQRVLSGGEWRMPDSAAIQTSLRGEMANPALAVLRQREDRAVSGYLPIRSAATGGTARAHNHTGASPDSLEVPITWNTISEPFSFSIKQGDNNLFMTDEIYASGLRNAILNIINRADAAFVAALVADKTQVNAGGGNGNFNTTPDVYEVPLSEKDFFFQNAMSSLEQNLYQGQLVGVIDSKAKILAQRLMNQGPGNDVNKAFQFNGMTLAPTTREVIPGAYAGSGMFFEAGMVSYIPWIPKQNRKTLDFQKGLSYNGDWGQIIVPELGAPIAIHMYAERADGSATNGQTQDLKVFVELSVDFGYISSPLSDLRGANDSVAYAVGQLAS